MARLEFAGARYVRNYHLAVPHHELVIDKKKSLPSRLREGPGEGVSGLDDNLILHGDNLKALKSLLPHFAGKVKCIYIDPPYNTGNEGWVYNDNVSSPRHKDWLGKVVDKECQDRHDRWLSMMMPRLKLLRELMREDGVIFVSIDDNEAGHLRMMMDEIFGEQNFVDCIVWQKKVSPSNDAQWFSADHDYILVFAKNKEIWRPNRLERNERQLQYYKNPDNDPRGPWNSATYTCNKTKEERPNLYYAVTNPNTKEKYWPKDTAVWAYGQDEFKKHLAENKLWWGADGIAKAPRLKTFLSEVEGVVPRSVWLYTDVGHTQEATQEFLSIFPNGGFATPKPSRLIERVIQIGADSDSLILDSFAGSGTTAHAVLALNKEDGGNRKFILVEQEDYADTITAERVRRVIKGVKSVKGGKDAALHAGLGGSFTYVTLGAEYDVGKILSGKSLPSYEEMASYVFQTATGETLDRKKIDKKSKYIGSSKFYDVYLLYAPDVAKLKSSECALKLDFVESLDKTPPPLQGGGRGVVPPRKKLVFGAVRYVNQETLMKYGVEFSQLPYEVYRRIDDAT